MIVYIINKTNNYFYFVLLFVFVLFAGIVNINKYIVSDFLWAYYVKHDLSSIHKLLIWTVNPDTAYPEIVDSFPMVRSGQSTEVMDLALNNLAMAEKWQPHRLSTYYLVGQIRASEGKWVDALRSLQDAQEVAPNNAKIAWKTALVFEKIDPRSSELILLYQRAGFNSDQFLHAADKLMRNFEFEKAGQYYKRAALLDAESVSDQHTFEFVVRKLVSKIRINSDRIVEDVSLASQFDNTFTINKLNDRLRVNGAEFRLTTPISPPTITFGTRVDSSNINSVGILWWTSQSMAIVSVPYDSIYQVSVKLRHSSPPPVEIVVGTDSQPLYYFTLERGDNSWEIFTFPIILSSGIHTIDVWFLNDGVVNGEDRNASINWIVLENSSKNKYK
jgi:hypothetical protein